MVKQGIKKGRFRDIAQLLLETYKSIAAFTPIVEHAKEMTDEFNDFPNDKNKVVMEMARNNVVLGAYKLADHLCLLYEDISVRSKKMFTFKEYSDIVSENLCGMLQEGCENG